MTKEEFIHYTRGIIDSEIEKARIEMLQKAGLLENKELAEEMLQIEKKQGYWPIKGMQIGSLTINLSRNLYAGNDAYSMSTGFVLKGLYFQTIVSLEDIMTLDHFVYYGINKHIYKMRTA